MADPPKLLIVGLSLRFPGGGPSVNELRDLFRKLAEGNDLTSEMPDTRYDKSFYWSTDKEAPGKVYVTRGGFLPDDEIFCFDRQFFRMKAKEAEVLDPQVRKLLELTYEACQDAGAATAILSCEEVCRTQGYMASLGGSLRNDGKTNGISTPSAVSQKAMILEAIQRSGSTADQVFCVEAHGTGTFMGDVSECDAVGRAIGQQSSVPLLVGSVKSNLAHMEGASGMGGLIKLACMMRSGTSLPLCPISHKQRNGNIDWEGLNITPCMVMAPWPTGKSGSLSSFGFGGANAHMIFEPLPVNREARVTKIVETSPTLLVFSARTEEARGAYFQIHGEWLREAHGHNHLKEDVMHSFNERASQHPYRVAAVGNSLEELATALLNSTGSGPVRSLDKAVRVGTCKSQVPGLAFVFSGMGTQYPHMAQLEDDTFLKTLKKIISIANSLGAIDFSLDNLLGQGVGCRTDCDMLAIFAVQASLFEWYKHMGIVPNVCIGHSSGEVAAAYATGRLSLEDAVRVIYFLGKNLQEHAQKGQMVALELDSGTANDILEQRCDCKVAIAAYNSAKSCVVTGTEEEVSAFLKAVPQGTRSIQLKVHHAFHGECVDNVREPLLRDLEGWKPQIDLRQQGDVEFISTSDSQSIRPYLDAEYWWNNIRSPVHFESAVEKLLDAKGKGIRHFVEVSPQSHLLGHVQSIAAERTDVEFIRSLPGEKELGDRASLRAAQMQSLRLALGHLWTLGHKVNFSHLRCETFPSASPAQLCPMPRYPWQREELKVQGLVALETLAFPVQRRNHPLLGHRADHPGMEEVRFEQSLLLETVPWVEDHKIQGQVIVPGMAFVETLLECGRQVADQSSSSIRDIALVNVTFDRMMVLAREEPVVTEVVFRPKSDTIHLGDVELYSQRQGVPFQLHARASLTWDDSKETKLDIKATLDMCNETYSASQIYSTLAAFFQLGDSFQCIKEMKCRRGQALEDNLLVVCRLKLDEAQQDHATRYNIHPALLDSVIQSGLGIISMVRKGDFKGVPYRLRHARLSMASRLVLDMPLRELYTKVEKCQENQRGFLIDVKAYDIDGNFVCSILGLEFRRMASLETDTIVRLGLRWTCCEVPASFGMQTAQQHEWLIVTNGSPVSNELCQTLPAVPCISWDSLSEALLEGKTHVVAIFASPEQNDDPEKGQLLLLQAIRVFNLCEKSGSEKLTVITQGGARVPGFESTAEQSAVNQMASTAMPHEAHRTTVRVLDAPMAADLKVVAGYLAQLLTFPVGTEAALRLEDGEPKVYTCHVDLQAPWHPSSCPPLQNPVQVSVGANQELEFGELTGHQPRESFATLGIRWIRFLPQQKLLLAVGELAGQKVLTWASSESGIRLDLQVPLCSSKPLPDDMAPDEALQLVGDWLVPVAACSRMENNIDHVVLLLGDEPLGTEQALHQYISETRGVNLTVAGSTAGLAASTLVQNHLKVKAIDLQNCRLEELLDGHRTALVSCAPWSVTAQITKHKFQQIIFIGNEQVEFNMPNVAFFSVDVHRSVNQSLHMIADAVQHIFDALRGHSPPSIPCCIEDLDGQAKLSKLEEGTILDVTHFRQLWRGTFIVAGGTKGLGLEMARFLKSLGAEAVVCLGRTDPGEDQLEFQAVDLCSPEGVRQVLEDIQQKRGPVNGIISAAAEYEDRRLDDLQDERDIEKAWKAKTKGTYNLHEASRNLDMKLDFFIAVSSIVTLFGNGGQSVYIAANGYIEGLMLQRRTLGLPGAYLNVGVVADTGYANAANLLSTWTSRGINVVNSAVVCRALGYLLQMDEPALGVSGEVNIVRFLKRTPHLIEKLLKNQCLSRLRLLATPEECEKVVATAGEEEVGLEQRLVHLFEDVIGCSVDETRSLMEQGLDSLDVRRIQKELEIEFQVHINDIEIASDTVQKLLSKATSGVGDSFFQEPASPTFKGKLYDVDETGSHPLQAVVVCVPPMACGPMTYSHWLRLLGAEARLLVARAKIPGWEDHSDEKLSTSFSQLSDALFSALQDVLRSKGCEDLPIFIYGQSFGAKIAFHLAERIAASPSLRLSHLYVGAWGPPSWRPENLSCMSQDKVLASLDFLHESLADKSDEVRQRTQLCLEAGIGLLMADNLSDHKAVKVACPVTCFSGKDDAFATPELMQGWDKVGQDMQLHSIDSKHHFLHSHGDYVTGVILRDVQREASPMHG